jgi:hypothetical protein
VEKAQIQEIHVIEHTNTNHRHNISNDDNRDEDDNNNSAAPSIPLTPTDTEGKTYATG